MQTFTGDYFLSWSRSAKRRLVLKHFLAGHSTRICDIVPIPEKDSPPSILVIFEQGEIVALSSEDWKSIVWERTVVLPPLSSNRLKIVRACFDSQKDDLYLLLANEPSAVFRVSRGELEAPKKSNVPKKVELDCVVPAASSSTGAIRQLSCLAVDSQSRLLFTCDENSSQPDVLIWQIPTVDRAIPSAKSSHCKLAGSLKSPIIQKPISCAVFVTPKKQPAGGFKSSESSTLLLAVADWGSSGRRVELFAADYALLSAEAQTITSTVKWSDSSATPRSISSFFRHVVTVHSTTPTSPTFPSHLFFDNLGNLFVVENGTCPRIQIFATADENQRLHAVWASDSDGQHFNRLIVARSPDTGKMAAIVTLDGESVFTFD